jgi:MFS family permease
MKSSSACAGPRRAKGRALSDRGAAQAADARPPIAVRRNLVCVLRRQLRLVDAGSDAVRRQGYSLADSTSYLIVSGIGFLIGAFATTRFSDRFERKYTAAMCAVTWAISLAVIGLFVSPVIIIVFGFIASMTVGLLVPVLYTYTAEHFSTNARATGVALTDGLGHVGGALAPLIVLGAYSAWGFSGAFIVMAITGLLTGALILFGIKATGRSLEAAGDSSAS